MRRTLIAFSGVLMCVLCLSACGTAAKSQAVSFTLTSYAGHGSIDEAYAIGAPRGAHLAVVNAAGSQVGSGVVDKLGGIIVSNLNPGPGYRFRQSIGDKTYETKPFSVLSTSSTPTRSFYSSQQLHAGLNYVRMRDGVLIAATVRLPPGKTLADGPFPTVIEYSGYAVAAPHSLINALTGKASSKDPLLPDTSTVVGSVIAPLLGFVTVSVQLRGTGCSGGAFDLFGLPTDYDGYDIVQTVGAQSWVLHHKVGMVGISYSGFSQLVVAGTDPPDLAAITPLSPTDDLYSTGYPGGIYNDGFAKSWVDQRIVDAEAAPGGGQPWATAEIDTGDKTCLANQVLHPEASTLESIISTNLGRVPSLFDPRSPAVWATHIHVPVFMVGALEDEQVGPQWPALISALSGDKDVYVTMMNGTHIDSIGPATITRWLEFLDIFVAQRVPTAEPILGLLAPEVYSSATGAAPSIPPPPVRFTTEPSVAAAKAAFESQDPKVRVLFDYGGGSLGPGALQPAYEADFSSWPPQGAVTTWELGPGGTLASSGITGDKSVSFRPNPDVRPETDLPASGNAWAAQPDYDWTTVPAENGIAFQTPAFTSDTTIVGPASLNLELESTAPVTDLQVTVTEVRPGNKQEEYVTSGFLRSSNRTLTAQSTALDPVPNYLTGDRQNLPKGKFTLVRIPIDPIAHTFRAGTSLRIVISAPGGDRPEWTFDTFDTHGSVIDSVELGNSTLVVNAVSGVTPTAALPACGSLRGEPCRTYSLMSNQS
ncbi:MAG: CocE/NonD family hydrolase [Acidimicrobiales bacterium]